MSVRDVPKTGDPQEAPGARGEGAALMGDVRREEKPRDSVVRRSLENLKVGLQKPGW